MRARRTCLLVLFIPFTGDERAESLVAGPSEVDAELPTDGEAKPEAEEQAAEP